MSGFATILRDAFRIRIWNLATGSVVYDNKLGEDRDLRRGNRDRRRLDRDPRPVSARHGRRSVSAS